ncbi:MAG TPA: hypothetical protein DEP45_08555 [Armatimonadetes bacterium]|nr:hypothetical protein [Armatimonadota bacterium]
MTGTVSAPVVGLEITGSSAIAIGAGAPAGCVAPAGCSGISVTGAAVAFGSASLNFRTHIAPSISGDTPFASASER